jgi:hypothetical protein
MFGVSFPIRGDDGLELVLDDFSAFQIVDTTSGIALPTGSDVPRLERRRHDDRLAFDRPFRLSVLALESALPSSRPEDCPRLRVIATRHPAHAPPARSVPVIEGRAAA